MAPTIVKVMSEGLVVMRDGAETCMWARWKSRKAGRCIATNQHFKAGTMVFGPLTNGANRAHRVLAEWVKANA